VYNSTSNHAEARAIELHDGSVFISGYIDDGGLKASYWKDGKQTLLNGSGSAAGNDIEIDP
jgi:hypothetical protein